MWIKQSKLEKYKQQSLFLGRFSNVPDRLMRGRELRV